jgi:hypothetical protein
MNKNINAIVHLFPDFKEKINFLFETDENFSDLCKDYLLCASNVIKMKKDNNKKNTSLEEYDDLKKSLQEEIKQIIIK